MDNPTPKKSIKGRSATGFASPSDDFLEDQLDLNTLFIDHPESTYLIAAISSSLCRFRVRRHDILIVDRAIKPRSGMLVVAIQHGQAGLVRLVRSGVHLVAVSSDSPYGQKSAMVDDTFEVWGVITALVHRVFRS